MTKQSWQTSSLGITTIVSGLVSLWFNRANLTPEVVMANVTGILSGVGLLFARDNNKSSEDVGAKP